MPIEENRVLWSTPVTERAGRPLLVLLHGHGMNERIGFELRHRLPASLVIASLRGPLQVRGGFGWFPMDTRFSLGHVDRAARSVLDWIDAQAGFSSVGLLGFSQGSAVAVECLRNGTGLVGYAILLSSFLNPLPASGDRELARLRPPVFSGRGEADHLVPPILASLTDRWLQNHSTLTRRVYPGLGHNVSDQEIDDVAEFLELTLPSLTAR
jgi:phospholipase/carboxylesterase